MPPPVLRRRRLVFFQVAWIILAVIVLGLNLAGVPFAYEQAMSVLAAESARELRELGMSHEFYAAYNGVGLPTAVTLAFFAVAAIIFWRRSEDSMALFGSFTLLVFGGAAVSGTMHDLADAYPAFWFPVNFLDYIGQVSFGIFFYLFPDGQFAPRWTRWLAVVAGLLFAINVFFPGSVMDLFRGPFFIAFLGSLLFVQIYRYRRVSNAEQRQQTKWVIFGSVVALVGFSMIITLGLLFPTIRDPGPLEELFRDTLIYGFILMIPLSIGLAILRHRLWDIDLIINRTLVYGALTACVVTLYVLTVGYLGALFQTDGNLLISLATTGIVAVLFSPLRERLQRSVNHLMYGERDEPYLVLSRLGQRLEATLEADAVLPTVIEVISRALKLPYAAIALKHDSEFVTAAEQGTPTAEPIVLPLTHQGEPLGQLILEPRAPGETFSPQDKRLLEDLARQAGAALHTLRIASDLQRSRERLVTAREEERRRLRRDLHDGLGPQLAAQTLKVGSARMLYAHDPVAADTLLSDLEADMKSAIAEIRRLVYGLRPPALDELGLVGAIREVAAQYTSRGLRIFVAVPEQLSFLPAAVEVAAYRIATEALTNVVRHAQAKSCDVRLYLDGGLVVDVSDDGVGLPNGRSAGVGFHSMRERAEELGGECRIAPSTTGGVHVLARLPLPDDELTEEE